VRIIDKRVLDKGGREQKVLRGGRVEKRLGVGKKVSKELKKGVCIRVAIESIASFERGRKMRVAEGAKKEAPFKGGPRSKRRKKKEKGIGDAIDREIGNKNLIVDGVEGAASYCKKGEVRSNSLPRSRGARCYKRKDTTTDERRIDAKSGEK